jgi:hypothetical protein
MAANDEKWRRRYAAIALMRDRMVGSHGSIMWFDRIVRWRGSRRTRVAPNDLAAGFVGNMRVLAARCGVGC